jgi:hypothetical protein
MNIPAIIAMSLITFLIAYPRSSPPKNPPPIVAVIGAKRSVLNYKSPGDALAGHGCTWYISCTSRI